MLIDEGRTREQLARITYRLSADPVLRDELAQEALVHLWLLEERRPGQRPSWYLQSCKYHLQNYLMSGRSIDSRKRKSGRVTYPDNEMQEFVFVDNHGDVVGPISARDILTLLSGQLSPFERQVLDCLSEGLGAREIAKRLDVTHPTIIKYRRRIAALATRLGIPSLPGCKRRPAVTALR
jgi:DNA-directed RNA polymerase specialized sigma24 family protein